MWLLPSPWPGTTKLYSGDEGGKKVLTEAEGDVRSETGKKGPFHQRDDRLASVGSRGTPGETFSGSAGRPLCPSGLPKRSKWQGRRIIPNNVQRRLSGKHRFGKTPMKIFLENKHLAVEKDLDRLRPDTLIAVR
jgi:hypothetical protein